MNTEENTNSIMEVADPLQKLLESTGWSCDDLLEKLQKLKSTKSTISDKNISTLVQPTQKTDNSDEIPCNTVNSPQIENLKLPPQKLDIHVNGEPFSDTDDEEEEVHITNKSIINEIIDDIAVVDTQKNYGEERGITIYETHQDETDENVTHEVTEVRVIEVDNDDEDDNFEDETVSKSCSENIQYWETYPRKRSFLKKPVIGLKRFLEEPSEFGNIQYIETYPRKRIKLPDENEKQNLSGYRNETLDHQRTKSPDLQKTAAPKDHRESCSSKKEEFLGTYLKFLETNEDSRKAKLPLPKKNRIFHSAHGGFNQLYLKNDEICSTNKILTEPVSSISIETSIIPENSGPRICQNFPSQNHIQPLDINHPKPKHVKDSTNSGCDVDSSTSEDESDENSPKSSVDDASSNEDMNATPENVEDLRNNLKMQLSSLRTKKREHFLQTQTKVVDSIECNNDTFNLLSNKDGNKKRDHNTTNVTEVEKVMEESGLFSQTNELGLVILDVQGGVEFDEAQKDIDEENLSIDKTAEENSVPSSNNSEHDMDDDQHVVFDQIRKIIHKQKSSLKPHDDKLTMMNLDHSQVHSDLEKSYGENMSCSDNSQSSFKTKTHEIEKQSPFVSDSLDEFLTGNSKLNISYKVPKCGAEDGLKENHADNSPVLRKKLLEIKDISEKRPKKEPTLKAKTVAQKRKLLERQKKRELKKLDKLKKINRFTIEEKPKKSTEVDEQNRSFILFNNEKIWVRSKVNDTCIAKIGCHGSLMNTRRKLSLLSPQKKTYMQVKYLPGPLCRKRELQITGQNDWETQTKNLPNIFLEVVPKIGQCLPDHIMNRMKTFNEQLCSEQIEFALSTLKTKNVTNVQPRSFIFPLKYHKGQEKIIVRKRKSTLVCHPSGSFTTTENKQPKDTVADVIEDLIRYIEIKEIAPTLIKEDESQIREEEKVVKKLSPISNNLSVFKKPQKKKSKIEYELSRLSCKVVNVEVEENLKEEICENLHCQLGCVCKSLKCENISNYHCQLVKCMFDCTCPKEKPLVYDHSLTLPAGTDILSTDTVSRIEDEAKKYLAKEEREFTQTVIHTNDKTIVVGLGSRNKLRRNAKTPAKYSDYIDGSDTHKAILPEKDSITKCTVRLPRLNLSQIIPYCLTHNLYNCYCEGKSAFIPNMSLYRDAISGKWRNSHAKTKKVTAQISEDELEYHSLKKLKASGKEKPPNKIVHAVVEIKKPPKISSDVDKDLVNSNDDSNLRSDNPSSQANENTNNVSSSKRPIRNKKQKKYGENFIGDSKETSVAPSPPDSARTRVFLPRVRTAKDFGEDLYQNDFSNNINDSDIFRAKIQYSRINREHLEVDILKQSLIEQTMGNILLDANKKKRKQTLSVRKDEITSEAAPQAFFNEDGALQRRKKSSVSQDNKKVKAVFDGEIIIDRRNSELLKKMGPKTLQDGYARLLPWKALTESFRAGTVCIWSMIDQPSRLLINKSTKKAPKNYVNIKQSNQTTEVILWILKNRLPPSYHEDSVSFILKETKNNFEICGVCTRNLVKEDGIAKGKEEMESTGSSNKGEVFLHRDVNGAQRTLEISKLKYKLQELVEESTGHLGEKSVDKNKLYMWVALPDIYRVCKWRVIYLNSDFAYLYFSGIEYSIRYTDLVNAGRIAKVNNCTLRLTNDTLKSGYDHVEFALYFDPHYLDRFFIGPYFRQFTGDDIETYRYINKSLVSTKSFNKMSGKADYKCGHWLIERPYSGRRFARSEGSNSTIDLTVDDDVGVGSVDSPKRLKERQSKGVLPHMVIMHNFEQILILDAPSRKPEDFNRYIITNIPHLGYLGAYRHSSGEIDVSWPFEEKLLRFSKVATAIDFLQERFSALLQPVPETFKINIIVLTQLDLENSQPIDSSVLSGHYICGEFGFQNITTMSGEDCKDKLGISREEILSMFSKRARVFLEKRIENLASLLNIEKNNGYDINSILNAATTEIHAQLNQEKYNISLKNELAVKKRDRAIKLFRMISQLPPVQRNIESQKFRLILNRTEPIEVHDSDEDSGNIESNKDDYLPGDKTKDETDTDNLKVLDPQQCLLSVMEAKNQRALAGTETKQIDAACSSFAKSSPIKVKQQSLLKPLIRVPIDTETSILARGPVASTTATTKKKSKDGVLNPNLSAAQYISGVKLVKSVSGNFVLVPDESPDESVVKSSMNRGLAAGTKVIIQNNKIKSLERLRREELDAGKIRKMSKCELKLNDPVECQVIESLGDIDNFNSDETIIIDLDESDELDNMLIQNDARSLEETRDCYNERVEKRSDEQDQCPNDKNDVVIITEDDILVHSDNVQRDYESVDIIDITQTSPDYNTVENENTCDDDSPERNISYAGTFGVNSDLVFPVDENCDSISSIFNRQSTSNNDDNTVRKNSKKVC